MLMQIEEEFISEIRLKKMIFGAKLRMAVS